MGGCSALKCSNSFEKGFQLFKFPKKEERRRIWVKNCKKGNWKPGECVKLCEVHFEPNQFEYHVKTGKRKLKSDAIPTIFDVPKPNAPKLLTPFQKEEAALAKVKILSFSQDKRCQSVIIRSGSNQSTTTSVHSARLPASRYQSVILRSGSNQSTTSAHPTPPPAVLNGIEVLRDLRKKNMELEGKVRVLEHKVERLQDQLTSSVENLQDKLSFLSPEQISFLGNTKGIKKWSKEGLKKAINMRYVLGIEGYNYLRRTGYPLPTLSTLRKKKNREANESKPSIIYVQQVPDCEVSDEPNSILSDSYDDSSS